MSTVVLENQMHGLNIVLGALKAATVDICKNCLNLKEAKTKVSKLTKKLSMDLKAEVICCEKTRAELQTRIDSLSNVAEGLEVAEECQCQKTAGNCKLGTVCFVTAAVDLMRLIQ